LATDVPHVQFVLGWTLHTHVQSRGHRDTSGLRNVSTTHQEPPMASGPFRPSASA
jgi:hypothetical protein